MDPLKFTIRFPDATGAEANRFAAELREALLDSDPDVQATQVREREDTMDWGTSLTILATSPVLVQMIKSLEAWMLKRREAVVEVSDGTRSLKMSGLTHKEAKAERQAFFEKSASTKEEK